MKTLQRKVGRANGRKHGSRVTVGVTQAFQMEHVDGLAKSHGQPSIDNLLVGVIKHLEHAFQSQEHIGLDLDSATLNMLLNVFRPQFPSL